MKRTSTTYLALATVASLAIALSGCSAGEPEDASALACGLATGEPATGTPIKLGAISTDTPGLVFTDSTKMAGAYFDCVNDNGGINGHPIDYVVYHDALDPAQTISLANQLINEDQVLGIVGGQGVLDCIVNSEVYADAGYFLISPVAPRECFETPNVSPVNVAGWTAIPAAQLLADQGVSKIVTVINAAPGAEIINRAVAQYGESVGIEVIGLAETIPITDANSLALRLVEEAGAGGGVSLNFQADQALQVLAAASQQGLVDKVTWACTVCADGSVAAALDPAWDGKLLTVSEYALLSSGGEDALLFEQLKERYADGALSSDVSGVGGFVAARIAVDALLKLDDDELSAERVNQAFASVTGFESDLLCKPWSYGNGQYHFSNDAVRGVVPRGGVFEQSADCFDVAAVPLNHLDEIRATR